MIHNITTNEIRQMTDAEGLVLQGCGGDIQEWLDGINSLFTEAEILCNGEAFKDIYVFEHDGLTNILFPFADIAPENLHIGRLAIWRLQNHHAFGGTWLSDYLPNRLGVNNDTADIDEDEISVLDQIQKARTKEKATPLTEPHKPQDHTKSEPEL
ncbi:MAG: hypothetical protein FWF47_03600 [Clostridia bacterium]|nr:hypothetical protein [Clostridia bacterium]